MAQLLGLVLAGGKSSRMGANKALIRPNGQQTMLERAVRLLSGLTGSCLVSCARGQIYPGFDCIEDGAGPPVPARGLLAGLARSGELGFDGVLALACDLPMLTPGPLQRLIALHDQDWATLYVNGQTGRVEMLAGIYSTAFLPTLASGLTAGKKSLYWLLPAEKRKLVAYGPDLASQFQNCNTKEDLARAVASSF